MKKILLPLALAILCSACPQPDQASPAPVVSLDERAPGASDGTTDSAKSAPVITPRPTSAVAFDLGKGIGPIQLGMTRSELDALGLPVEEGSYDLRVGPYRLLMDGGKVSFIEIELAKLKDGMLIGGQLVLATERDIERIAKLLPGCGKLDIRLGGNVIECAGGTAIVAAAGPPGIVQLKLLTKEHVKRLQPPPALTSSP